MKELWEGTLTNLERYKTELQHWWYVMGRGHLPRFKQGTFDPREKENYFHLVRNLFTETFRALPRTLSGLLIIWLLYLVIG